MHDPMVVAFEIRRPWPKISKISDARPRGIRGAFWRFRNVELYWPGMLTIWHVEPDGRDAFEVCGPWQSQRWRWHVHHWRLQFAPWQHFRRWAFTRCTWCGGPSRRGDYVNTGRGWDAERKPKHWWQSEVGLYHRDCLSIEEAHRECICPDDVGRWRLGRGGATGYGDCLVCMGFRLMPHNRDRPEDVPRRQARDLMRTIPRGGRDAAITAQVEAIWREFRERAAA